VKHLLFPGGVSLFHKGCTFALYFFSYILRKIYKILRSLFSVPFFEYIMIKLHIRKGAAAYIAYIFFAQKRLPNEKKGATAWIFFPSLPFAAVWPSSSTA
jgi:hypothetical protein